MDLTLFDAFVDAERKGLKAEAKRLVRAFVGSFETEEERAAWVWANWQTLRRNGAGRMRFEIWEGLARPVFLAACAAGDPKAMIALASCEQEWQVDRGRLAVRRKTAVEFWGEAYAVLPGDPRVRRGLLHAKLVRLDLTFHEWPAGLLVDYEDWREEAAIVARDLDFLQTLDDDGRWAPVLAEYRAILRAFRARMERVEKGSAGGE